MAWLALLGKWSLTAAIVAVVSELAQRSTIMGSLLASIPIVSILSMIWINHDTQDTDRIADFAEGILWLFIPSLVFFIILPPLLRKGMEFWPALGISSLLTIIAYVLGLWLAGKFGGLA
tara:strand:- start:48 stop:404 length:357 start_codon:yes stop_codon:yes gene_type:complete